MFTTKEKKQAALKELDELKVREKNLREIINEDEKPLRETITTIRDAYRYLNRPVPAEFLRDLTETMAAMTGDKRPLARLVQDDIETVIEAISKQAGFVPDYSDDNQKKWYPYFVWDKSLSAFRFHGAVYDSTDAVAGSGSRQVLPTKEDAEFVGKTFVKEYNILLTTK